MRGEDLIERFDASLESGPYGVLALLAIATAVLVPATQYNPFWGFTVGYGLSVATMAYYMRKFFKPEPLSQGNIIAGAAIVYGIRLALYLYIRDLYGWKPYKPFTKRPRLQLIPFALALATLYAFMTLPVLYALRAPATEGWPIIIAWTGAIVAWAGALLEAIADSHKHMVKQQHDDHSKFVGPTTGVYRWTRHPNFTGELLFWFGIFLSGALSFDVSWTAWICSSIGLSSIVGIMKSSTRGLEGRQQEKYGGQKAYEKWKQDVQAPLFPFVHSC